MGFVPFLCNVRCTNVKTEFLAGVTNFVTIAYILAVIPSMLSKIGMPKEAIFTSVAIITGLMSIFMGFYANLPFILAPGLGLCAYFTYSVVLGKGYSWQVAITAVFIEGVIFFILSVTGVRTAIVRAIPENLQKAISVGIGLFISLIGLQNASIVVRNPYVLVQLGDISKGEALLGMIGIVIIGILLYYKIKGSLLLGILLTTLLGIPLGITKIDNLKFMSIPDSFVPVFAQFDFSHILCTDFLIIMLTFLSVDIFDTLGTLIGVFSTTKLFDDGERETKISRALIADSVGTTIGALFGLSTVTTYVESTSGIAEGGRTGLTAIFTGLLFFLALMVSPLFLSIPSSAISPALIVVGVFMIKGMTGMRLDDYTESIPAFLTIIFIPLTFSIGNGIMVGLLSYTILKILCGKYREVSITTFVISLFFLIKLFIGF